VDRWENPLTERVVLWTSSDKSVAGLAAGGTVTALRPGTVVITATCEDVSASIQLRVERAGEPVLRSARLRRRRRRRAWLLATTGAVAAGVAAWYLAGPNEAPAGSAPGQAIMDSFVPAPATVALPETALVSASTDSPAVAPAPARPRRTRPRPAPRPVIASVSVTPVEPLAVGDSALLEAVVLDLKGQPIPDAPVAWRSSDLGIAEIDPSSGRVRARSAGTALIIAQSGEESSLFQLTVRAPELAAAETTGQALGYREPEPAPPPAPAAIVEKPAAAAIQEPPVAHIRAGVEECYEAVQSKNVERLTALYHPETRSDEDKLRKLSRILGTSEWGALVGPRVDGLRQVGRDAAAMEFSFQLAWKDAFGGRLSSRPVFRAEFTRDQARWRLASCRIVGSPRL
jgi:hypothetical protein